MAALKEHSFALISWFTLVSWPASVGSWKLDISPSKEEFELIKEVTRGPHDPVHLFAT
jgi:hypothetical protein